VLAQAAIVLSALAAPIKPPAQACAQPQYTRWSWSPGEIVIGSVFTTALWVDRKQTLALRAAGYRETNWFTGPRPSAGRVNMSTISFTIVGLGTAAVIPRGGWRVAFIAILAGGELAAIQHNLALGFPIRL